MKEKHEKRKEIKAMFKLGFGEEEDTVLQDILNGPDVDDDEETELDDPFEFEELELDCDEEIYMSPEEEDRIMKQLSSVTVRSSHTVNYFRSKEEEARNAELNKEFLKLQKYKYRTRKIETFIDATRQCFKCLDMVARGTESGQLLFGGVDEFKVAWLEGRVKINGLWRPKYIGKDAKTLNWDYLWDYILDPSLPSDEFSKKNTTVDDLFTKSPEEFMRDYEAKYGKDFYDRYWQDTPENRRRQEINDSGLVWDKEYLDEWEDWYKQGYDKIDGVEWLCKLDPTLRQSLSRMEKESERANALDRQMNDEFVGDSFGTVGYFDREYDVNFEDNYDIPEFKGSIFNKKDFDDYIRRCDEWEEEHVKVNFRGAMMSKQQADYNHLIECMDKCGINTKLIKVIEDPSLVPNKIKKRRKAAEKNDQMQKSIKKKIKKMKKMQKSLKKGKIDQNLIDEKLKSLEHQTDYKKKLEAGSKKKKKKVKKKLKKAQKEVGFDLLEYPEMEKYTEKAKKKATKHMSKEDARVYDKTMSERQRFIKDQSDLLTGMIDSVIYGDYKDEKEWSENIGKWDYDVKKETK